MYYTIWGRGITGVLQEHLALSRCIPALTRFELAPMEPLHNSVFLASPCSNHRCQCNPKHLNAVKDFTKAVFSYCEDNKDKYPDMTSGSSEMEGNNIASLTDFVIVVHLLQ